MEKLFFKLVVTDDYPPVSKESVWAEKQPCGSFVVKNIPFYATDVCLDDEVSVKSGAAGENEFEKVIASSGNSTIRIIFFEAGRPRIPAVLESLGNLGCTWEGMSKKFFSINIPANVVFDDAIDLLTEDAEKSWLEYEYGLVRQ